MSLCVKTVHHKERAFQCNICRKSFSEKRSVTVHISAVHENIKAGECPVCERKFSDKGRLSDHIKFIHLGIRRHQYPECNMKFSRNETLVTHVNKVHHKLRSFECTVCFKKLASKMSLGFVLDFRAENIWLRYAPRLGFRRNCLPQGFPPIHPTHQSLNPDPPRSPGEGSCV